MVWLPTVREKVLMLAVVWPPLVLTVMGVPIGVPLSKKVTVPVGEAAAVLPGALTVTVAVKVTVWPKTEGLEEAVTTVVVSAWLTVGWTAGEAALGLKLPSPLV